MSTFSTDERYFFALYLFKKSPIYFIYSTFIFYSILFFETIIKPIIKIEETILISKKATYISNDLYILLFDEYPSEEILKKYTQEEINEAICQIRIDRLKFILNPYVP